MKIQTDHKVVDSFVEWFEHVLLHDAEAYFNVSTPLFENEVSGISGMSSFSAPFYQWVADQSITGANIPTASGLGVPYVDYKNGRTLGGIPSGDVSYSVKEFNIYSVTTPLQKLIFEDRYQLRPDPIDFPKRGLPANNIVVPAIFIRPEHQNVENFAFGGSISRKFKFNALIYSDDEFKLHAVVSVFQERLNSYIPVLNETPFNYYGDYKTGGYNYEHQLQQYSQNNNLLRITSIQYHPIERDSISKIHPDLFLGRLWFELALDMK